MYGYNRTNYFSQLKYFFRSQSTLAKLILVNIIVWLSIRILGTFFWFFNMNESADLFFNQFLALPAYLPRLITRPWTIFTYMFLHYDFLHILFNMLWLFWFGKIFTEYLNSRQLLVTYIMGGLAGALFFIGFYNLFPVYNNVLAGAIALGASASVMAVVISIAVYVPNYSVALVLIGPVRIKYIAIFSIIMDLMMLQSGNSGGHLAHLGGALWGLLFSLNLKKGRDLSANILVVFNRIQRYFLGFRIKPKPFRHVHVNSKPLTDEEYNIKKANKQEAIDKILDKISQSGYDSLTKEEKEFLFRSSNQK